jgi:hypothetical protein
LETPDISFEAKFESVMSGDSTSQAPAAEPAQIGTEAPTPAPVGAEVAAPEGAAPVAQDPAAGTEPDPEGQAATEPETQEPAEEYGEGEKPNVPGMTDTRWGRYSHAYKFAKALAQAFTGNEVKSLDPNLLPSVDELTQYRNGYIEHERLAESFLSGRPEHAEQFVQHWNQQSPEAMAVVADRMQDVLAHTNAPAYQRLASPVIDRFLGGMYQQAMSESDPAVRENMVKGAQMAEWWFTGGPRGGTYRQIDLNQQVDPLAQREAAINQKMQYLQQQEQRTQQAVAQQWQQRVDSARQDTVTAKVDKALGSLKAAYEKTPKLYDALKSSLIADVERTVGANPAKQVFDVKYDRVLGSRGNDQFLTQVMGEYGNMVDRAIAANLSEYLRSSQRQVTAAQQGRQDALRQAASQPAPSTAGAPVHQPLSPNLNQLRTMEDKIDALLSAGLVR